MYEVLAVAVSAVIIHMVGFLFGTKYRDITDSIKEMRHHDESAPPEIVVSSPRNITHQSAPEGGTVVVTTKTPQQFEKEAREEVDRIGGIDG